MCRRACSWLLPIAFAPLLLEVATAHAQGQISAMEIIHGPCAVADGVVVTPLSPGERTLQLAVRQRCQVQILSARIRDQRVRGEPVEDLESQRQAAAQRELAFLDAAAAGLREALWEQESDQALAARLRVLLLTQREWRPTLDYLIKHYPASPHLPSCHALAGDVLWMRGDLSGARDHYDRVLALGQGPLYGYALLQQAELSRLIRGLDAKKASCAAAEVFDSALVKLRGAEAVGAAKGAAIAWLRCRPQVDARVVIALDQYMVVAPRPDRDPDFLGELRYRRGSFSYQAGHLNSAALLLRELAEGQPGHERARKAAETLIKVLEAQGDQREGAQSFSEQLDRLLRLHRSPELVERKVQLQRRRISSLGGAEAAQAAVKLLQEVPDYPRLDLLMFEAGTYLKKVGKEPEAAALWERIRKEWPGSPYAQRR